MLEILRRGVRSWVAKLLFGLLVVSFAVWGVGDVSLGLSTRVATVGDRAVEADAYGRALRRATQEYQIDPSEIRSTGLDRFVLAQMIRQAAFDEAAAEMGVDAPDSAVAEIVRSQSAFQTGGEFDPTRYSQSVRRTYGSVGEFEETVRSQLSAALISDAARAGVVPPPGAAEALARREAERRRFDALLLTAEALEASAPEPTEAELQVYLEENPELFENPERRDVVWIAAEIAEMAAEAEVSEAELRALYDERGALYATEERREVDQIVYEDRAAAEAAAEQARSQGFGVLLEARGIGRGEATLGVVTRTDMFGAAGQAAFAAEEPGVVGPVETPGGFAVLEVRSIDPAVVTPFEDVREDLLLELGGAAAREEAARLAERVEDERAAGATLEEAAEEFGLELRRAEGLTRAEAVGGDGLSATPQFLEEAFAAEPGEARDLQRTPQGGWFILRVDEVEPARPATLDEARERVAAAWADAQRREAVAEAAEAARARLAEGADIDAVAEETGGEALQIGPIARGEPDPRLGAEARETLFSAEPGAAAVTILGQTAVVARLAGVETPEDLDELVAQYRDVLAASLAQDQVEYLGRALEARAGVSLEPATVDSIVSQIGG